VVENIRFFIHRDRLSGQRRFIHLKVPYLQQAHICGHLVAGLQKDDVARDHFLEETRRFSPARRTVASVVMVLAKASMALTAFASWIKPMNALISTTPIMTRHRSIPEARP